MPHTPLPLRRVIPNTHLADDVHRILSGVPSTADENHGVTLHIKGKPRALVFWGEFAPDRDALANRIRDVLGRDKYEVSQCGPPSKWGKFRTATEEDPLCY